MKKNIFGSFVFFFLLITSAHAQLNPDPNSVCNGNPTTQLYALRFGSAYESIFSSRQPGVNQNGLDFVTANQYRIRITSGGNIAFGTYATPSTRLSFGTYTYGTDLPMRLSVYDNTTYRFGLGYFETSGSATKVFSFHVSDPTKSRFAFFDDYSSAGVNGYEFVTFNAANRSVGVCNTNPSAKLHVVTNNSNLAQPTAVLDLNVNGSASSYPRISFYQNFTYNPRSCMDATLFDVATSTNSAAPLYLQSLYSGNVGIGGFGSPTNTTIVDYLPMSKLHVNQGAFQVTNSGDMVTQTTGKTGLMMGHFGDKSSTATNSYSWIQSSKGPLLLNPLAGNSLIDPQTNNYVAIGYTPAGAELTTLPPVGYNLLVKGKVMCEELKIKLKPASGTAWPDYVFASDYKLMSVDSLQNYIALNKHLPDVPSATEVEENGIMAGEMNGILLKKIEELTLYMLEQDKNISTQAEQIELLKKQNELLMQQMQLLISKEQN